MLGLFQLHPSLKKLLYCQFYAMLDTLVAFSKYGGVLYLVHIATLVFYRLYLHPLRHIPGPALAKATYLHEWYFDLYLRGQYTFRLKDIHEQYGMFSSLTPWHGAQC